MTNSPAKIDRLAVEVLLQRLAADEAVTKAKAAPRPFQPPALPPGVVPKGARWALATDSGAGDVYGWLNGPGGVQGGFCGMGFPGYPYLANLSQRSEYRAPVEVMAAEMTREWIKLTGADEAKKKELDAALEEFAVRDCVRDCIVTEGFFGLSQLYVQLKGQDSDQRRRLPLIVDDENKGNTVPKGSLLGFKPVEPMWSTPYSYNSNDPTAPDFYKPALWYVMGKPTHGTRLLTFISRPLPDILKPSYNFGGMSMSQLIEPYVQRWLKTVDSVNRSISNFSITTLSTNLQAVLEDADDGDARGGLIARLQLFTQMRDNRGIFALDKASEELGQENMPLTGLSELQAQAQEHMAAPTHIPLVKLTGITPSGLNASSEGEIKVFYDWIAAEQENLLSSHMMTILRILQLHLWGAVDPDIGFEWVPLDSPTDKELAEMRKADGDRDVAYVTNGVVSADEVRERLREDPTSGYTFIEGDAPTPPDITGKETDHALGEESADNQANRDADAREHAAKLEPAKKD